MIYKMNANPNVWYRRGKHGWEYSDNGGHIWYYTMRTDAEIAKTCTLK